MIFFLTLKAILVALIPATETQREIFVDTLWVYI